MRLSLLSAVAALALTATPVLAAQNNAAAPSRAGTPPSAANVAPGANITMQTQQKLRQSLIQAGFKNVSVTAQSYVIHATGPDGSPMVMMVSPDQVTGMMEESGSSMPPAQKGSTTGHNEH